MSYSCTKAHSTSKTHSPPPCFKYTTKSTCEKGNILTTYSYVKHLFSPATSSGDPVPSPGPSPGPIPSPGPSPGPGPSPAPGPGPKCNWDDTKGKCCNHVDGVSGCPSLHPLTGIFLGLKNDCGVPQSDLPPTKDINTIAYFTTLSNPSWISSQTQWPIPSQSKGVDMYNYIKDKTFPATTKINWFVIGGAADNVMAGWAFEGDTGGQHIFDTMSGGNLMKQLQDINITGIILDVENITPENNTNKDFLKYLQYFKSHGMTTMLCTPGLGPEGAPSGMDITPELLAQCDYWVFMWYSKGNDTYTPSQIDFFFKVLNANGKTLPTPPSLNLPDSKYTSRLNFTDSTPLENN